MDNLGIAPPVVVKPVIHIPNPAPVAQKPEALFVPMGESGESGFDPESSEQQRLHAVERLSQQVSDIFVVSDRTFTIFKDVSGQYITRFTSLRDGKVTYIPEPNLFRLGGESDSVSVKIKA